jgi:hypothetical protein
MKNIYFYLSYDLKQIFKRKATKFFFIILLIITIADTFYTLWTQSKFFMSISEMSATWYVHLENSDSIIRGFYFSFMPIFAALPFGAQYYYEKDSDYRKYLISRGNRRSYFLSKYVMSFIAGFVTIFIFLIINYILVHLIYPNNFMLGGTFLKPDSGAFLESLFYKNVHLYEFFYIIINSIVGGIISLLSLSLCMLFNYKNVFLVIAVPFIIYTIQSVLFFFINPHYDIMQVIQPHTRFALVNPINTYHVVISIMMWFILANLFFLIGYRKERDIL